MHRAVLTAAVFCAVVIALAFVPLVGGDPIGRRPVDFHVEALTALGAEIEHGPTGITARAARLRGARITLPYPSVGATETVLLSAVLADCSESRIWRPV